MQCSRPIAFEAPKTPFEERLQQQANAIRRASHTSDLEVGISGNRIVFRRICSRAIITCSYSTAAGRHPFHSQSLDDSIPRLLLIFLGKSSPGRKVSLCPGNQLPGEKPIHWQFLTTGRHVFALSPVVVPPISPVYSLKLLATGGSPRCAGWPCLSRLPQSSLDLFLCIRRLESPLKK